MSSLTHAAFVGDSGVTGNGGQVAIGSGSNAYGPSAIAIGGNSKTDTSNTAYSQSIAIGYDAQARADQSIALGANTRAKGNTSIAIGGEDLDSTAYDPTKNDNVTFSTALRWDKDTLKTKLNLSEEEYIALAGDETQRLATARNMALNNTDSAKLYKSLTG